MFRKSSILLSAFIASSLILCTFVGVQVFAALTWTLTTVDTGANNLGFSSSMVLTPANKFFVSSADQTNADLKISYCDKATDCDLPGEWTTYTVLSSIGSGSGNLLTSMASDTVGNLHLTYYQEVSFPFGLMKYTYCPAVSSCDAPADWITPVSIDQLTTQELHSSIAVDLAGNPRVAYFDRNGGGLDYAFCSISTGCDDPSEWSQVNNISF
jgi:hypothetical protein